MHYSIIPYYCVTCPSQNSGMPASLRSRWALWGQHADHPIWMRGLRPSFCVGNCDSWGFSARYIPSSSASGSHSSIAPEAGAQRSQSTLSGPRSPRSENSIGSSLRKVLLATYASGKIFEETQQRLHESLAVAEIAEHWAWNQSMFQGSGRHADWYKQHERVNFRRGGAWKPYIIWQALRRVKWGDWLVLQLRALW